MKLFFVCLLCACCIPTTAQELNLSKVMSYFRSQDEDYIKSDLKARKFNIQKERPADTEFFDTEVRCLKSTDGQISSLTGIVILKIGGSMVATLYMTMKRADFNKKLSEIRNRGYEQQMEDTSQYWYYEKADTIITGEIRELTINGRKYLRYEIAVALSSTITPIDKSLLFINRKRNYNGTK